MSGKKHKKRTQLSRAFVIAVLVVSLLVLTKNARAEPSTSQFYEKDYAKTLPSARKESVPQARKPAAATRGKTNRDNSSAESRDQDSLSSDSDAASALTSDPNIPYQRSVLMLVVNSKDAKHLEATLAKAISLVEQKRILLSSVMHIGDYRTITPPQKARLEALAIPYIGVRNVPFVQDATMSPTWIFQGKDGMRVVEGFIDIDRFINSAGEYREIQKLDAMELPADKLSGF